MRKCAACVTHAVLLSGCHMQQVRKKEQPDDKLYQENEQLRQKLDAWENALGMSAALYWADGRVMMAI